MIPPSVITPSTSSTRSSIDWSRSGRVGGSGGTSDVPAVAVQEMNEVGNVEQTDRPAGFIDDGELADLVALEDVERVGEPRTRGDGQRPERHHIADRPVAGVEPAGE